MRNNQFGRKYHFNFELWDSPRQHGFVNLHQLGEVHCESTYEIKEHIQVCNEISYVISGDGIFYINDVPHKIKAEDIIITRIGDKHKIVAESKSGLHFFYIGFTLSENESMDDLRQFFMNQSDSRINISSNDFTSVFLSLLSEFYFQNKYSYEFITSLLEQIVIMTYRVFNTHLKQKNLPIEKEENGVGATIYSIIKYIDENIDNIVSIRSISKELGYSYNYFSRMFKEKAGITLRDYIYNKKIEKSIKLIESNRYSITRIAIMLGYNDVQSFSKAFKRTMNMSPSEYKVSYNSKDKKP